MIKILVGNVGTGKTTYVRKKCSGDKWLTWDADSIRSMFHAGTYIFDEEENEIILRMRSLFIMTALKKDFHICLDNTTISKSIRGELLNTINTVLDFLEKNVEIVCVDFGPGTDESLKRRNKNPRGHADWKPVHEKFLKQYDQPSLDEGFNEIEKLW